MASSRYDFQQVLHGGVSGDILAAFPSIQPTDIQSDTDIFLKLQYGQRIDQLAYNYLGSGEYWWVICLINGLSTPFDSSLIVGKILRIPSSVSKVLKILQDANS